MKITDDYLNMEIFEWVSHEEFDPPKLPKIRKINNERSLSLLHQCLHKMKETMSDKY